MRYSCSAYIARNDLSISIDDCLASGDEVPTVTPDKMEPYEETQQVIHYTLVFQTFVFMQIFNQINARLLEEGQYNIFAGIHKNPLFLGVVFTTIIVQMTIVEIGGLFTKTSALNMKQNMACMILGAGELLWGVIIKRFDAKRFELWQLDEPEDAPADAAPRKSVSSALKRQKTSSMK